MLIRAAKAGLWAATILPLVVGMTALMVVAARVQGGGGILYY
jgi:hypothetical protein